MGSEERYEEEGPVRRVQVDGFWMDHHPVTNREFAAFVQGTGYRTVAEQVPAHAFYPDGDPTELVPGSSVFVPTSGPVSLGKWWQWIPGADWQHPRGPGSSIVGSDDHPVTHVAWDDIAAYASWSGKALPTEAEWEFAARGGLDGAEFTWGGRPSGRSIAPRQHLVWCLSLAFDETIRAALDISGR